MMHRTWAFLIARAVSEIKEFVVEVELTLRSGDPKEIQARMDDLMNRRRSKQPLEMHSAGSTFKQPPGNAGPSSTRRASKVCPSSGRRDTMPGPSSTRRASKASCGDARLDQHAGFVVNTGHASAGMSQRHPRSQKRVEKGSRCPPGTEVRIIGED